MEFKICNNCKEKKPDSDFCKNSQGKRGVAAICKICSAKNAEKYRKLYPIKKAALKFKVSEEEILKVWYKTYCDICGNPFKENKRHSIDHCHTTGKIRGLLCDKCNTGLGMFRDSPTLLQNAIKYLIDGEIQ